MPNYSESQKSCRLYLISPPSFHPESFAEQLEEALEGENIAAFQLRLKNLDERTYLRDMKAAVKILMPICQMKSVAFIINDDHEIALELGADGVHIGQEDGAENKDFIGDIRKKAGAGFIIGASCYDSKHLAMNAAEAGADYVSFGAFFPSKTKQSKGKPTPEILEWWSTYTNVPCVAIGGINAGNCGELSRSGADFLAIISAIWEHPFGPSAAIKEINAALQSTIAKSLADC